MKDIITAKLKARLLKISSELIHCIPFHSKHFSYLLYRNNILSVGYNHPKTSTLAQKLGFYDKMKYGTHAEIHAILNFPYGEDRLRRCKLINIRIGAKGDLRIAKPCPICTNALDKFQISDIIYTDSDGRFVRL